MLGSSLVAQAKSHHLDHQTQSKMRVYGMHSKRTKGSLIKRSNANEETQALRLSNQFMQTSLTKVKVQNNVYVTVLTVFVITFLCFCYGAAVDFYSKYQEEEIEIRMARSECEYHYQLNRCEDPVPEVRAFCLEKEKCLLTNPEGALKLIQISIKVFAENFNVFTGLLSIRSYILILVVPVAVIVLKANLPK